MNQIPRTWQNRDGNRRRRGRFRIRRLTDTVIGRDIVSMQSVQWLSWTGRRAVATCLSHHQSITSHYRYICGVVRSESVRRSAQLQRHAMHQRPAAESHIPLLTVAFVRRY